MSESRRSPQLIGSLEFRQMRESDLPAYKALRDAMLERLRQGVELEDGVARFESIYSAGGEGANQWFRVTLKEGRNRIVRRLWESQNIQVSRLMRVAYGPLELPRDLPAGQCRRLGPEDCRRLYAAVRLP